MMKKVRLWPVILSAMLIWSLFGASGMAIAEPTDPAGETTPGPADTPEPSDTPEPAAEQSAEPTLEPPADGFMGLMAAPKPSYTLTIRKEISEPLSYDVTFKFNIYKGANQGGQPADTAEITIKAGETSGSRSISLEKQGMHSVIEVEIPPNFSVTSDNPQNVNITNESSVTFKNKYTAPITTGSIEITKNFTGAPVPDDQEFTFTVYNSALDMVGTATVTGGGTHTLTFDNLPAGEYTVWETPVAYYTPDAYWKSVTVSAGGTASVAFTNDYAPPLPTGITINKTVIGTPPSDATFTFSIDVWTMFGWWNIGIRQITGANSIDVTGLTPGIIYRVTEINIPANYSLSSTPSQYIKAAYGYMLKAQFTNTYAPNGSIAITKSYSGAPVPAGQVFTFTAYNSANVAVGSATITSPGTTATISDLPAGEYTVEETPVPYYTATPASQSVTVTAGGTASVSFDNEYNPRVTVKAFVFETGTTTALSGAEIELVRIEGGVETDRFTDTTDADGLAEFSVLPGDYKLQQKTPPTGYHPDTTVFDISLTSPGSEAERTFYNDIIKATINTITLSSHDSSVRLAGAKFSLFEGSDTSGTLIGNYETDALGQFSVPDLYPGTYTLLQTAAPAGYNMDSTASTTGVTLTVGPGEVGEVTIQNTPIPSTAVIVLKASDTNNRLSSVQFSLYRGSVDAGNFVGSGITDLAGNIVFSGLTPGAYIIVQDTVFPGYNKAANVSFTLLAADYTEKLILINPEVRIRIPAGPARDDTATPTPVPTPSPTPTPIPSEPVVTIDTTEPPYGPATGEQTGLLITAGILALIGAVLLVVRRKMIVNKA